MTTTVEDIGSVDHAIAVPVSDEQLWQMSAEFIAHGLARGGQVFYFDDGTAERVLERLADDGVAVAGPLREGRFTVVPGEVTRAALNSPLTEVAEIVRSTVDSGLSKGYPTVWMTGQLDHGLQRSAAGSMPDYDRVIDAVVRHRPAHVLCFYDRVRYPESFVEAMRAVHDTEVVSPAIYDDGLLRLTAAGPGAARVAGEVDHSNRPRIRKLLEAALDRALRSPDVPADITLDLSSLRVLDVTAAVGLVHAAEEFPSAHRLVLTGVRPRVQRLLDRCGAPFADQLVVRARTDPAGTEPDRAEPDRTEPDRTEPDRTEPDRTEPARTDPADAR